MGHKGSTSPLGVDGVQEGEREEDRRLCCDRHDARHHGQLKAGGWVGRELGAKQIT